MVCQHLSDVITCLKNHNCSPNSEDSKVAGEAQTTPNVRLPPLKEGRLPRLMQAVLECRLHQGQLPDTDFILLFDGGREGGRNNQVLIESD